MTLEYTGLVSGLAGAGKTAWINALSGGLFSDDYSGTIGSKTYQLPLNTTAGEAKFTLYECNTEELCAELYAKADFWLFFVAPEQLEDIPKLTVYGSMKATIIVISQADRLDPSDRAKFEKLPNYSVISTKDNYNIYDPLNKALANFPNQPKIISGGTFGPFIILMVGNEGAGKSSWIRSLTGESDGGSESFAPTSTRTPQVYNADITTSKGTVPLYPL